ncbi:hypothetical protein ACHAW5_007691 [Stephanodiscus triporus]|uniref:Uncharacterized protein n=1 Tax=Stephanodiscus triporus TaxID=2934178 RepID=A0ABD3Q6M3_9STRA
MERPKKDPRGYCLLCRRFPQIQAWVLHFLTVATQPVRFVWFLLMETVSFNDYPSGLGTREELTFDYNAVTESVNEYRFAVCFAYSWLHEASHVKEDSELLLKHGFNTAAFGAVSFNHHVNSVDPQSTPDSIENVPIWLRTFVADCLRYIEYERRALPVALLCNQMERLEKKKGKSKSSLPKKENPGKSIESASSKLKSVAGSKPMTSYFSSFRVKEKIGKQLQRKNTSGSAKAKEAAKLTDKQKLEAKTKEGREIEENDASSDHDVTMEAKILSIADADAEGFSAMEQRIQQLAQSLSRVGRVLDRHRESVFSERKDLIATVDCNLLRSLVPPLKIMSDEEVVSWIWSDSKGVIPNMLQMIDQHFPEQSLLSRILNNTLKSFPVLSAFSQKLAAPPDKKWKHSCTSSDARRLIQEALLKLRMNIIDFLTFAEKSYQDVRNEKRREQSRAREEKKTAE